MNERIDMLGQLTIQLTDRTGAVVYSHLQHNRIVRTGRLLVAQLFGGVPAGAPPTQVTHIGIGTGATPPGDTQTTLVAERSPRKALAAPTYTDLTETAGSDTVVRVRVALNAEYNFDEGNGAEPLREAAIFTADTGGTMYNRVVFDPVTKSSAFRLSLFWEVLF
jgi:hypothetical protein